jgi:hypothetical protein
LAPYKHIENDVFEWTGNTSSKFFASYVIKSEQPGPCVNVFTNKEKSNFWANNCNRKFEFMCSNNVPPNNYNEEDDYFELATFHVIGEEGGDDDDDDDDDRR